MGEVIQFQKYQSERARLDSGHRMFGRWRAAYYRRMTASAEKHKKSDVPEEKHDEI